MKIIISGRKVNLKDNFKERIEKKLSKFSRIFGDDAVANVTVTVEKNRQTVEITIHDSSMIYRVENTTKEMNDALDKVVETLGRQIRKNKSKLEKRIKSSSLLEYIEENNLVDEPEEEFEYKVVKSKQFPIKPLVVDEAILQMNMIGHSFYMFRNVETNEVNVVYRRKDGAYGLLEPEV